MFSFSADQPHNATEGCVGPTSQNAGKESVCEGCPNQAACSAGAFSSPAAIAAKEKERTELKSALENVAHVILVLSGKGGVGKSTVATQLAQTLSLRNYSVGLLDVDICGPSIPRMAGVLGREVHQSQSGWEPVYANANLAVMSISFLLEERDAAVVWRGPRKNGLIKQFFTETDWGVGGLDYLIIDTPPGTSDEHISIVQYLNDARRDVVGQGRSVKSGASGAIIVTTPEEVSMSDVRKELNFCKKTNVPVLGVIENMSGFQMRVGDLNFIRCEGEFKNDCTNEILSVIREKCPELLDTIAATEIFPASDTGPIGMAKKFNVPYLGKIPLDPNLLKSCEEGVPFIDRYQTSPAALPLQGIVNKIIEILPVEDEEDQDTIDNEK